MKIALAWMAILLYGITAQAHECWLAPQKYSYQAGEKNYLRWQVGENFTGENWTGSSDKAIMLQAFSNLYQFNLLPLLSKAKGDSIALDTMLYAGNYTIVYQGNNSFIETPSAKFNAYLAEDGLDNAILWRKENNKDTSMGREYYQRSAKTLIRIKSALKKSDYIKNSFVASSVGLTLDIVPLDNPYNFKTPTNMQFNVYYKQRPLRDGLVRIWHRVNNTTTVTIAQVVKGIVETTIEPTGAWMISLVKMEPIKADATADWQSYWSSITWQYD